MNPKLVVTVGIVLVLAAAGCGSGKKKSAAQTTTAAAATTTSTSGAATTALPGFASTKNCQQLLAVGAKIAQALQPSAAGGLGSIGDEAKVFKALASSAPADIRGDFETFATAFTAYAQALAKAGLKAGTTPTAAQIAALATAARSFNTPKLLAAEQHLAAWGRKNCGVGQTTTG